MHRSDFRHGLRYGGCAEEWRKPPVRHTDRRLVGNGAFSDISDLCAGWKPFAAAGAAAHLGGVIASYTTLPVIGVPVNATPLNGMDALLSTVQMPSGIPVATVAINGAKNAAVLALQILSVADVKLQEALKEYREKMQAEVEKKAAHVAAQIG